MQLERAADTICPYCGVGDGLFGLVPGAGFAHVVLRLEHERAGRAHADAVAAEHARRLVERGVELGRDPGVEAAASDRDREGVLGVVAAGLDALVAEDALAVVAHEQVVVDLGRLGAGAYICGEETALFASIEGFRGEPRTKPPFPVEAGLFGRPTVVNNVETLVNVLGIVADGAAAYRALGTAGSPGTRLFCVSGNVARPGLYELPFGVTLRALLDLAGADDPAAVLLGGAAGTFVGAADLELPLTFEDTRAAGATLGSGVVLVLDRTVALGPVLARIAQFFRDESCGQCVPCRVGTVRQEELITRLARGAPRGAVADERALLAELGQCMRDASICGLGQTASSAIESAVARLKVFADEVTP